MDAKEINRRARIAVKSIEFDMNDRRGLHLSVLDASVQREIRKAWIKLVEAAFTEEL